MRLVLFLFFIFLPFFGIANDSGQGYLCPPVPDYGEVTLKPEDAGNYSCVYKKEDGTSLSTYHKNPQKNSNMAIQIANLTKNNKEIKAYPPEKRRLKAVEKILSAKGLDPSGAQAVLDSMDVGNENQIEEALNSTLGDGADEVVGAFSAETLNAVEDTLSRVGEMSLLPSKDIAVSSLDITSHEDSRKTLPAIIVGALTLDKSYFDSTDGTTRYINDIGEISINKDLISVYKEDHTKNSFLGKYLGDMTDFFFQSRSDALSDITTFKPLNFMDPQIFGFMTYLVANINSAYNEILYIFFATFVLLFGAKYIITGLWGRVELQHFTKGEVLRGKIDQIAKKRSALPFKEFVASTFLVVFFLGPIVKNPVTTTGAMSKAVYVDGATFTSSSSYGYSTAAQETIRYAAQSGNYFGNLMCDYGTKAYTALLNFKMGFVQDGLPRYIGKTREEVSRIQQDKARLAADAMLYNTACKPYKTNGGYNVPASQLHGQQNSGANIKKIAKISVVGDETSKGIGDSLQTKGITVDSFVANGATVLSLKEQVASAVESDSDAILIQFGLADITSGSHSTNIGTPGWESSFNSALAEAVVPAVSSGKKIYCVAPPKGQNEAVNTKLEAVKKALNRVCGMVYVTPALAAGQLDSQKVKPNSQGFTSIADYIAPKINGVQADRIDSESCRKLENSIVLSAKSITKSAAIANENANTAEGFADNIKKTSNGPSSGAMLTTDPNLVYRSNRKVHGDINTYWHGISDDERGSFGASATSHGTSNANGWFAVPMSPETPGWTAVGEVSEYGKVEKGRLEAGTVEETASGEKIRGLANSGALVAASWHFPLNTIVEAKSANGQSYRFRTTDRGPLVVLKNRQGEKGIRPVAQKSNPWRFSTRFFDLTPTAMNKMCYKTGDITTFKVVAYNAPVGYNPKQPQQNPDGTLAVSKNGCGPRKLMGQNLQETFVPAGFRNPANNNVFGGGSGSYGGVETTSSKNDGGIEYIVVDNSPHETMEDFVQLIAFTNKNFGWVSVAMVPSSYEFFKFVNMYFVQDSASQMAGGEDIFAQHLKKTFKKEDEDAGIASGFADTFKFVYTDLIIGNSTWFIVPGFDKIYETIDGILEKFLYNKDGDKVNGAGKILTAVALSTAALTSGSAGGFASGGESGMAATGSVIAIASLVAIGAGTDIGAKIMLALVGVLISIAIVTMMISIISLMLITSIIIIKIILYFIDVLLFFMFSPAIGLRMAMEPDGRKREAYVYNFIKKLSMIMISPTLIVVPAFLFIPVSEFFRGLLLGLVKMMFVVFEKTSTSLAEISEAGVIDSVKQVTILASMSGIVNILSIMMSVILVALILTNFRGWMMDKIGMSEARGPQDQLKSSEIRQSMKSYVSPL